MWSSGLRRACGAARLRQLPTLRQFPTLVHARSYACQKLEEQISIKGRLRPVTAMEDARRTFWRSGWLPAQVHGDKLGPVYLSVPFNEYMSMARKPHIQRKLLRINVEDEGGTPTGESLQVLTDEVFNKLPISSKWNGDYDYITFRRWPRSPPLKMKIPLWVLNEDKCPKIKAGGYSHEFFSTGLPCLVSDPDHIPMYLEADMAKATEGDLRIGDVELPPGVVPVPHEHFTANMGANLPGRSYPNFLICRSTRIRG